VRFSKRPDECGLTGSPQSFLSVHLSFHATIERDPFPLQATYRVKTVIVLDTSRFSGGKMLTETSCSESVPLLYNAIDTTTTEEDTQFARDKRRSFSMISFFPVCYLPAIVQQFFSMNDEHTESDVSNLRSFIFRRVEFFVT
jgi:hypothetical protein